MSHDLLKQLSPHPARLASITSIEAVQSGNKEAWLAMWHPDACLEDPVGVSMMDPEGKGHRGIEAITAFWDQFIGPADIRFHIRQSFACGNECANVGTITTRTADGTVSRCELVMVYRVDDDGKTLSLRAFWEEQSLVADIF